MSTAGRMPAPPEDILTRKAQLPTMIATRDQESEYVAPTRRPGPAPWPATSKQERPPAPGRTETARQPGTEARHATTPAHLGVVACRRCSAGAQRLRLRLFA